MNGAAPTGEEARLAALAACAIMDTPREVAFDNLVYTVAQLFRSPMAMLSLVDATRVWTKAAVGSIAPDASRSDALCHVVVESRQLLVIEDATIDARFTSIAAGTSEARTRFFAAAPLHGPGNHVVGVLCVLDRQPRTVPERQRAQLLQLARQAGELLRMRVPDLDLT